MLILGIETSCDETAISIIETEGKFGLPAQSSNDFHVQILANEILSQIAIHREYGGVFPMLAKREHAKTLVPLLIQTLKHSNILKNIGMSEMSEKYNEILNKLKIDKKREPELWAQFEKEIPKINKPEIDAIAVTRGPGLEPALWTGINFAKALSAVWNIPLIPINHMEGHIFASLLRKNSQDSNFQYSIFNIQFPTLALLISGGHTELVLMKNWFEYEILGATRDDAVGEAFDKVARILGLPYPGGPEISKLAENWRSSGKKGLGVKFPRPMIKSGNSEFSFSGLKTSVLYAVKKLPGLTADIKAEIAAAFEDAVIETLLEKTRDAILKTDAKTLVVGGGVAANKLLREKLAEMAKSEQAEIFIPEISHSTDNALMIAVAASLRASAFGKKSETLDFGAQGGLKISVDT